MHSQLPTLTDESAEETPANAIQSSPKLSDRLRDISNSLKLLSTMPVGVVEQKTPEAHLKFRHAEDLQESLKARSTGVKVTCLNSLCTLSILLLALVINPFFFFSKAEITGSSVLVIPE